MDFLYFRLKGNLAALQTASIIILFINNYHILAALSNQICIYYINFGGMNFRLDWLRRRVCAPDTVTPDTVAAYHKSHGHHQRRTALRQHLANISLPSLNSQNDKYITQDQLIGTFCF